MKTSPAATSQKALPPLLLCSFVIFVQFQIIHWFKEQELQLILLLQLIPPSIKSQNFVMNALYSAGCNNSREILFKLKLGGSTHYEPIQDIFWASTNFLQLLTICRHPLLSTIFIMMLTSPTSWFPSTFHHHTCKIITIIKHFAFIACASNCMIFAILHICSRRLSSTSSLWFTIAFAFSKGVSYILIILLIVLVEGLQLEGISIYQILIIFITLLSCVTTLLKACHPYYLNHEVGLHLHHQAWLHAYHLHRGSQSWLHAFHHSSDA